MPRPHHAETGATETRVAVSVDELPNLLLYTHHAGGFTRWLRGFESRSRPSALFLRYYYYDTVFQASFQALSLRFRPPL